ncbi:uncharacterized protein LOC126680615 [Mercurialis annua]|uniref:uncharacterized protein LOC126680615 n=1 Tax=Mercurialis annua TaxID=3986 RepID=UPI00215FE80A|nr:uncharacterized protein LOC126680615 [Mercurialis annua]XP_050231721.1 uncharacterized protein LOC126680615 [Mercurialis annua]
MVAVWIDSKSEFRCTDSARCHLRDPEHDERDIASLFWKIMDSKLCLRALQSISASNMGRNNESRGAKRATEQGILPCLGSRHPIYLSVLIRDTIKGEGRMPII